MNLEIIYEDEYLIAINKPHGLLVHRSSIATNTDLYALQLLRNQVGYHVFPVHRLDRKTAGVLVFSKTSEFVAPMQQTLHEESTAKRYHAIVRGFFSGRNHCRLCTHERQRKNPRSHHPFQVYSTNRITDCTGKTSDFALLAD